LVKYLELKIMKSQKTNKSLQYLVDAINEKKEIKTRVKMGENINDIAKEKGFKIVQPL
jgi:3-methyladenine DNA glycosylase AlkC